MSYQEREQAIQALRFIHNMLVLDVQDSDHFGPALDHLHRAIKALDRHQLVIRD